MAPNPGPTREGAPAKATTDNAEPAEGEGQVVETQPQPLERRAGLQAIIDKRRESLEAELNEDRPEGSPRMTVTGWADGEVPEGEEGEGDPPPPADEEDGTPPPDEGVEAKTPPPAASGEAFVDVTLEDGSQVRVPRSKISTTVKLDGEEVTVDGNALATGYQKDKVSTARFRAADEKFAEADRLYKAATAPQQDQRTTQPDPAPERTPAPSDEDLENDPDVVELMEVMQYGDPKEAARKFAQVMGKRQPAAGPTIDAQEIVQQAVNIAEHNRQFQDDLEAVAADFPGIFNDNHLWRLAANEVHQIRAEYLTELGYSGLTDDQIERQYAAEQAKGTVPSRRDVFFAAANRTADWVKKFGGTIDTGKPGEDDPPAQQQQDPPPSNPRTFERKAQDKRGITTSPTPSSGVRHQPPAPAPAQTGADIVAEARKARGQAY